MSVTLYAALPQLRGIVSIQEWAEYAWDLYRNHLPSCSGCGVSFLESVNDSAFSATEGHCKAGSEMIEHAIALDSIASGRRIQG